MTAKLAPAFVLSFLTIYTHVFVAIFVCYPSRIFKFFVGDVAFYKKETTKTLAFRLSIFDFFYTD